MVLIDTWWNVNIFPLFLFHCKNHRFNRYMVECESEDKYLEPSEINSFNRYMVECEFKSDGRNRKILNSFNRYMVECEWKYNVSAS